MCNTPLVHPVLPLLLPTLVLAVVLVASSSQIHVRGTTHRFRRRRSSSGGRGRHYNPVALLGLSPKVLLVLGLRFQNIIGVYGSEGEGFKAKRATTTAVRDSAVGKTSARYLADVPDVSFDSRYGGDETSEGRKKSSENGREDGEPLSPTESAEAWLADGEPRCYLADEPAAKGGRGVRRRQCLPTVFFLGVSKCGTTSLSEWMSHHPRARWVRRPQHLYYLEAHVFDIPPDPEEWRRSARLPSSLTRDRLAVEAEARDTVIDYTPHYSLVAEVPFRISDLYGDGPLRERGLKFLVVLREPAARTISSWEYKTDPEVATRVAKARHPEALLASLSSRAIEARPLEQAVAEGMEMATRLFECVANATEAGGFGRGQEMTSCGNAAGVPEDCEGEEGVSGVGGVVRERGHKGGDGEATNTTCETYFEPLCNPRDFLEQNLYDAHVGKSMYALQLGRWFSIFGKENFKVIFTEDLALDPMATLEEVLDFLNLDLVDAEGIEGLRRRTDWADVISKRSNEADPEKAAQLSSQATPEVIGALREFFKPHNRALEELLGAPVPRSWQS